ncbi:D-threo-aldose 1-dehydrogenase [Mycetocola sp. BIGb0189]|uniref:aldo/keto reductase n=1 Tax=Mycetocola sp. BIGb0189 TaxID=2940604 RepID=UPI002167B66B|nr:aldo/keto reductase [Mycetocola sp. BIGb0189]MCS4277110.1 D-threo-aldose 1-dehydrogenase [Mycetocola sp. BIGb0189]
MSLDTLPTRALGRGGLRAGPFAFGAAQIANLYREVDDASARAAVDAAWDAGVRYFDSAPHYGLGLSERRLGEALASRPRDEYVLSTKVGRLLKPRAANGEVDDEGFAVPRAFERVRDYSRDGVLRSIEASLTRLGTDRIDVVFVHDPDEYEAEALASAFPALDELRREGVIASYGAGMNQSAMLARFVRETDLDVIMQANRYTLLEQEPLDDLLPAALDRNVSIVAAAVFNSGLLARDRPAADAPYNYGPAGAELIARVNRIADVCEAHGVTLPAAAAQFPLAHPAVATVCLGSRTAEQVIRNAALFEVEIPDALWSDLVGAGLLRADAPVPGAR